ASRSTGGQPSSGRKSSRNWPSTCFRLSARYWLRSATAAWGWLVAGIIDKEPPHRLEEDLGILPVLCLFPGSGCVGCSGMLEGLCDRLSIGVAAGEQEDPLLGLLQVGVAAFEQADALFVARE